MDPQSIYETIGLTPEIIGLLIGLTALSGTFYFVSNLIKPLWNKFIQLFYLEIEIYFSDPHFGKFNLWLKNNSQNMYFLRGYKCAGNDDNSYLTPGYGRALIKAPGYPFIIYERFKEEKKQIYDQAEILKLRFITFQREKVYKFFEEISQYKGSDKPSVFESGHQWWDFIGFTREISPPISDSSYEIIEDLDRFISRKSLYKKRGIPYRRGYLLYGPAGTGKSSLISYISQKYNLDIYLISNSKSEDLQVCIGKIPPGSLIVIEDIDLTMLGHSRKSSSIPEREENKSSNPIEDEETDSIGSILSQDLLRTFLNLLDGIVESNGSIFICTTNNKEGLDSALLRPGRIDKMIYLGPLNTKEQVEYFNRFFESNISIEEIIRKDNYPPKRTIAELQELCISNMDDPEKAQKDFLENDL